MQMNDDVRAELTVALAEDLAARFAGEPNGYLQIAEAAMEFIYGEPNPGDQGYWDSPPDSGTGLHYGPTGDVDCVPDVRPLLSPHRCYPGHCTLTGVVDPPTIPEPDGQDFVYLCRPSGSEGYVPVRVSGNAPKARRVPEPDTEA